MWLGTRGAQLGDKETVNRNGRALGIHGAVRATLEDAASN